MAVLLVTYDLNSPGQDYSDLLKEIKSYPWTKLSESSYGIKTNRSPKAVYGVLWSFMDKNDQLYVITLSKPFFGYGPEKVNQWLNENL